MFEKCLVEEGDVPVNLIVLNNQMNKDKRLLCGWEDTREADVLMDTAAWHTSVGQMSWGGAVGKMIWSP